jgi:hypothetical protein
MTNPPVGRSVLWVERGTTSVSASVPGILRDLRLRATIFLKRLLDAGAAVDVAGTLRLPAAFSFAAAST